MELMERVKAECTSCGDDCRECRLKDKYGRCNITKLPPIKWDIEAIRKALDETSDKASDKEEIVVPEKWTDAMVYEEQKRLYDDTRAAIIMEKQNEIIDCLEQIKERMK